MRVTSNISAMTCLLLAGLPLTVSAQQQTATFSPDASKVSFTLKATDHTTEGVFHVTKGVIQFDRAKQKIGGLVVVSAGSGSTGNGLRDRKMANEVLAASQFAEITFAPTSYTGTVNEPGDSMLQVTGSFSLHGAVHEITVALQLHLDGEHCIARTTFPVPYVEWGLHDPSILFLKVAKDVQVTLFLNGRLTP